MNDQIKTIQNWLGTGSINIFGLPLSGKDTQGIKLAETLDAKFLSSGMIIRAMESQTNHHYSDQGILAPTNIFYEWVLPYFERPDLYEHPLILSSIGRWHGEETQVMSIAAGAGHEIKAVIFIDISETEAINRFNQAKINGDRGNRADDQNLEILKTRLEEFRTKTLPVIEYYKSRGLLININGDQTREQVFSEIIQKLSAKAKTDQEKS